MSRASIPKQFLKTILQNQNYKCKMCTNNINLLDRLYEVDHIIPYAIEQKHRIENLQILCLDCHRRKTRKDTQLLNFIRKRKSVHTSEAYCFTC